MTTAVRSDEPVTALVTHVTYQAVITVLDGSAVVWRDLYGAASRAQHHPQADVGTAGVTINKGAGMSTTTESTSTNGVDTATLFATLDAVKDQPEIAKFQFRARNSWLGGTHSRSTFSGFHGAMQEMEHKHVTAVDADHPVVLVGRDEGPTPVEYLLHGLAGCLTAGLANIAAARGIELTEVTSTVEGDIDLNGILGLDPEVRNGFSAVRVSFALKGDAPAEKLRALVEQSRARSAVFDVLTNGVPVSIEVDAG